MRKVAVTGNLASGKTTVCRLLGEQGAYVLSADDITHELYSSPSELGKKIIELLGSDVVVQGTFDRKKIADKVFGNPRLLRQLEQLLHPEVQKVIEAKYRQITHPQHPLFVVEIPLLFESALEGFYDLTIAVIADDEVCEARFKERGGDHLGYLLRKERLMPMEEKVKKAGLVVTNNGSLEDLRKTIEKIYQNIT